MISNALQNTSNIYMMKVKHQLMHLVTVRFIMYYNIYDENLKCYRNVHIKKIYMEIVSNTSMQKYQ